MPIYEYFCIACRGRFRHLARQIDEEAPACPRCGALQVERLVSAVNIARGDTHHQRAFSEEAAGVNCEDPRAVAEFLKESGRLEDSSGLFGSKVYKELIARRMEGAGDSDLSDLVDDLVAAVDSSDSASGEAQQIASALAMSEHIENRMRAEGPPEDHDHAGKTGARTENEVPARRTRRSAQDLGWG